MRTKQFLSLLLVLTTQLFSDGAASGYTSKQRFMASGVAVVDVDSSGAGSFSSGSGSASSSVTFPEPTLVIGSSVTEQPMTTTGSPTETPTAVPSATTTTTPAPVTVESKSSSSSQFGESSTAYDSENSSRSQTDESNAATPEMTQLTPATSAPIVVASPTSGSTSSDSSSNSTTTRSNGPSTSTETGSSNEGETFIAKPSPDSSTFQTVESEKCSKTEVDNIYTLYSNCRSAFDLCVSASDYQIFPYQGDHPTQDQIQGMAESDACIAMFTIVIEANFSACTIGGMPLASVVETLLKISVDLQEGLEDDAPSTDVFQELVTWRYEVDLAKTAGVPYDGSSDLYADFEMNLNAAIKNTTIRVNEDLTVDVRLSNGSFKTFEDAIDLVVADSSATVLMPGYVVANSEADVSPSSSGSSSSSSRDTNGIGIESSSAVVECTQTIWSLVVAVVASAFLLVEGTSRRV